MEKKLRIGRSNVGEINLWRRINVPSKSIYRRRKKKNRIISPILWTILILISGYLRADRTSCSCDIIHSLYFDAFFARGQNP